MNPKAAAGDWGWGGGTGHDYAAVLACVSSLPGPRALMLRPPPGSSPGGFWYWSFAALCIWSGSWWWNRLAESTARLQQWLGPENNQHHTCESWLPGRHFFPWAVGRRMTLVLWSKGTYGEPGPAAWPCGSAPEEGWKERVALHGSSHCMM